MRSVISVRPRPIDKLRLPGHMGLDGNSSSGLKAFSDISYNWVNSYSWFARSHGFVDTSIDGRSPSKLNAFSDIS